MKRFILLQIKFIPCVYCAAVIISQCWGCLTQSLVIISYKIVKSKKMLFYIKNNFCPKCFLSSLWNVTENLETHCPIWSLLFHCSYLFMDFCCFQDFSFSPPPSTDLPDSLRCCIVAILSHSLGIHSSSTTFLSLKLKEKLLPLLQCSVLTLQLNSALLKLHSSKSKRSGTLWFSCKTQSASNSIED